MGSRFAFVDVHEARGQRQPGPQPGLLARENPDHLHLLHVGHIFSSSLPDQGRLERKRGHLIRVVRVVKVPTIGCERRQGLIHVSLADRPDLQAQATQSRRLDAQCLHEVVVDMRPDSTLVRSIGRRRRRPSVKPHVFSSEAAADHLMLHAPPPSAVATCHRQLPVAAISRNLQCAYDSHDSMEPARYRRLHSTVVHPNTHHMDQRSRRDVHTWACALGAEHGSVTVVRVGTRAPVNRS